jgi:hypothetical protein|tara:strand:+ start:749 stop:973 length:225 start_codon:yes stop_codon:yes gene_type:complete
MDDFSRKKTLKEEDKEELLCYVSLLGKRENELNTALVLRLLFSTRTSGILRPRGGVIMVMKFSKSRRGRSKSGI